MAKYIDAERYINNLRELRTGEKDTVYEYYDDGIDVAISEAAIFPAVDVPRWIPVTERLPEESGEYLVVLDSLIYFSWFYKDDGVWSFKNADIVAWMRLPEPYKKGEQNG